MGGASRTVFMEFPPESVGKPLVSRAVRGFDVEINILRAEISPSEVGGMLAVLEGAEAEVEAAIAFLRDGGVRVLPPEGSLVLVEDLCVHCGACAGQCPTGALSLDGASGEVALDLSACIACGICLEACSYGAMRAGAAFAGKGGAE
jgi:ferredoxin